MAFPDGWTKKILQTLIGATPDAPYRITVHAGSGTHDAANLYLSGYGARNDFQDVVFATSDLATVLSFRRVSVDFGVSAVFEINPPFSGGGDVAVCCGNATAAAADDWNGTSLYTDDGAASLITRYGVTAADGTSGVVNWAPAFLDAARNWLLQPYLEINGTSADLKIAVFDRSTQEIVQRGTVATGLTIDNHNFCTIAKTSDGHYHVCYSQHNAQTYHRKTTVVGSVDGTWSTPVAITGLVYSTYNRIFCGDNDRLVTFARDNGSAEQSALDMAYSDDGGATWTNINLIDWGDDPNMQDTRYLHGRIYSSLAQNPNDPDDIRLVWTVREGESALGSDLWYLCYARIDLSTLSVYKTSGAQYSLPINYTTADYVDTGSGWNWSSGDMAFTSAGDLCFVAEKQGASDSYLDGRPWVFQLSSGTWTNSGQLLSIGTWFPLLHRSDSDDWRIFLCDTTSSTFAKISSYKASTPLGPYTHERDYSDGNRADHFQQAICKHSSIVYNAQAGWVGFTTLVDGTGREEFNPNHGSVYTARSGRSRITMRMQGGTLGYYRRAEITPLPASSNWVLEFDLDIEQFENSTSKGRWLFGLSEADNDFLTSLGTADDKIAFTIYNNAGDIDFECAALDGTVYQNTLFGTVANQHYYVSLEKSGTTLTAYVHSDAARSTLLYSQARTIASDLGPWNYLWLSNQGNSSYLSYLDADLSNLQLKPLGYTTASVTSYGSWVDVSGGATETLDTLITSISSADDRQAYRESVDTLIQSGATVDAVTGMVEALLSLGVSASTAADVQGYADGVSDTIISAGDAADAQDFIDGPATTGVSSSDETDTQSYVDNLADTLVSASTVTDTTGAPPLAESLLTTAVSASNVSAAQAYVDTVTALAVSASSLDEVLGLVEQIGTVGESVSAVSDRQLYYDNVAIVALSSSSITAVGAYIEQVSAAAVSVSALTDVLVGSFVGRYIFADYCRPRSFVDYCRPRGRRLQ